MVKRKAGRDLFERWWNSVTQIKGDTRYDKTAKAVLTHLSREKTCVKVAP